MPATWIAALHGGHEGIELAELLDGPARGLPPREEAAAERVAGTDGVDHVHPRHGHLGLAVACDHVHRPAAGGEQYRLRAEPEHGTSPVERCEVGEEVREVLVAHLHDVGAPQHALDPGDVRLAARNDPGPAVDVDHHGTGVGRGGNQRLGRTRHRFEHEPEPTGEQHGGLQVAGHLGQRRRRRALEVEAIGGRAALVELRGRQRGGQIGAWQERRRHAVGRQLRGQHQAETISRDGADEGDVGTEATARACGVERCSAQRSGDVPLRIDDEIDQRFSDDDDHGRHHHRCSAPLPRSAPRRPACRADVASVLTRAGP